MDFKQLEAFSAVVSLGSFSRAGERLFLTQPTISAHIRSLERELGVQLVVRTTKEVYPSEEGKRLYAYAQKLLRLRDDAIAAVTSSAPPVGGIVTVAASSIPAQYVLPGAAAAFGRTHPDAAVRSLRCDSAAVVRQVAEGTADLGMIRHRDPLPALRLPRPVRRRARRRHSQHRTLPGAAAGGLSPLAAAAGEVHPAGGRVGNPPRVRAVPRGDRGPARTAEGRRRDGRPRGDQARRVPGTGDLHPLPARRRRFRAVRLLARFPLEGGALGRRLYLVQRRDGRLSPAARALAEFLLGQFRDAEGGKTHGAL